MDALGKAQADGRRLQSAIDAEYRGARRDNPWGRTQPQIVQRWRLAMREIRDALAGKMTVLGLLVEEGPGVGGGSAPTPPPRSVWRKP